jgi:hypothetical protein
VLNKSVSASTASVHEDFVHAACINTEISLIVPLLPIRTVASVGGWVQKRVARAADTFFSEMPHKTISASALSQYKDFVLFTAGRIILYWYWWRNGFL